MLPGATPVRAGAGLCLRSFYLYVCCCVVVVLLLGFFGGRGSRQSCHPPYQPMTHTRLPHDSALLPVSSRHLFTDQFAKRVAHDGVANRVANQAPTRCGHGG